MANQDGVIAVKDLTKRFDDIRAVDSVSFTVQKGEMFAFLGPNGAGKSTTIKILTTLMDRSGGEVTVAGIDPGEEPSAVRRQFGIVFQEKSHDEELTAWENMEYHGVLYGVEKKLRRQRIQKLLEYVDLWERQDDYVKTFSGGMKRRLEIARGLIHHPDILFMDEPTLGLDPQTRNYIWEYVGKLADEEAMTVFFTTHYMEEAERNADRIAIIDAGEIIAIDSPGELIAETNSADLEAAFLELTGKALRDGQFDPQTEVDRHLQSNS
jgi:ABC-2 type transport system ATP-binding protein